MTSIIFMWHSPLACPQPGQFLKQLLLSGLLLSPFLEESLVLSMERLLLSPVLSLEMLTSIIDFLPPLGDVSSPSLGQLDHAAGAVQQRQQIIFHMFQDLKLLVAILSVLGFNIECHRICTN